MSLAIILLNWNDEEQTIELYRTVKAYKKLAADIIVVDNNSTKDSLDTLLLNIPVKDVIQNKINGGFAGGNNLGIREALRRKKEYVLLLNTDAHISEQSIMSLIVQLEKNPNIGGISPCIKEGDGYNFKYLIGGRDIAKYSATKITTSSLQELKNSFSKNSLHFSEYISGTIFLTRTVLFQKLGFLDERYFFSGEIADFCKKVKKSGSSLVVDLAVIGTHRIDKTDEKLRNSLYAYYSLRNRFLYVQKHYSRYKIYYYCFWIIQGIRQLPGALLKADFQKIRAIFLAIMHGLSSRFGDKNYLFLTKNNT